MEKLYRKPHTNIYRGTPQGFRFRYTRFFYAFQLGDNCIEILVSYFSKETSFDISSKKNLQTICKKCQRLFIGENKRNAINLSSGGFAH